MNLFCSRRLLHSAVIALAAAATASCDGVIYDDQGDCSVSYSVGLTYTTNIKFADAFPAEVSHVNMYVFTKQGSLAGTFSADVDQPAATAYSLPVNVAPGTYDIVVWATGTSPAANPTAFEIGGGASPASPSALTASLPLQQADGTKYVDRDITPLYHAYAADVVFPDTYGDVTVGPIDLTKDTNRFSILLQNIDGTTMMPSDFTFEIVDDNANLSYLNTLLPSPQFAYRPWAVTSTSASFDEPQTSRTQNTVNGLLAEISTGRLFAASSPVLVVHRNTDNEDIIRINLLKYLLMVKGEYNRPMTDQEYLDRNDLYTLMFFISPDKSWYIAGGVYINGWRVVPPQDTEL